MSRLHIQLPLFPDSYDGTAQRRLARQVEDAFARCATDEEIDEIDLALEGKIPKTGISVDANGDYLTTLAYNETTRTVTIAPTGTSFEIFIQGTKYTFTGAQSIVHSATQGDHFIYFDSTGTLVTATTPWDLFIHAPVCFVMWDATNSRGIPFEERHHAGRDVWWHENQHFNEGTKTGTGFGISGYTLADGSTDAAVTWAIASGLLYDEDIQVTTQALADGGPYTILERSGASGVWLIDRSFTLPFFHSGNVLQYNQNTGATWQRTNLTEDTYVNYYVFAATAMPTTSVTPAPSATQQIVIVPGQAIHATEALASAETNASISWGTLPFQEIAPLYKVMLRYNAVVPAAYSNTARCAIISITRTVGTAASITLAATTDHGSLTGLSDLDHPASAIINTPSGNLAATDVQAALNELQGDIDTLSSASGFPDFILQDYGVI